ncbi:hypothetical protein SAMN05518801_10261 [Novosphingobium sp. CF614]|nr:hypothetical protein SAMN05518801_10261 [Novosphingobium sp. CF614]
MKWIDVTFLVNALPNIAANSMAWAVKTSASGFTPTISKTRSA